MKYQFVGILLTLGLHKSSLVYIHNEHRILPHKIQETKPA